MTQISSLSQLERSLMFVKLSAIAYFDPASAKRAAKRLGFTSVEFYDKSGAQAYRFQNKHDLVIACRGTEPSQFSDIKADLQTMPVRSESVSRVHRGFKTEVDDIWPDIRNDISRKANVSRKLWFCGHSLGAAMATIMAARCKNDEWLSDPEQLYTYGSPRVGWRGYCKAIDVEHYRWKNNNDIVTSVPLLAMGYRHHGTEQYINAYGLIRNPTTWQRIKDKWRGMLLGAKMGHIDVFDDHNIQYYITYIERACKEESEAS